MNIGTFVDGDAPYKATQKNDRFLVYKPANLSGDANK